MWLKLKNQHISRKIPKTEEECVSTRETDLQYTEAKQVLLHMQRNYESGKKMRIVKLKGGLGNQMFQYTYAKLIQKNTGDIVKLDYSAYESLDGDLVRKPRIMRFNLQLTAASQDDVRSVCKFTHSGNSFSFWYKIKIYLESKLNKNYAFELNRAYIKPSVLQDKLYFDGYWQSWRYVDAVIKELLENFVPNTPLSNKTFTTQKTIKSQEAVFIGVRKGDYKSETAHYGSFDSTYYQKAMAMIDSKATQPVYYVFSNDIPWCKENINWGKHTVIYREPEDQTDDFEELMLMSSCKHAIIVNSSYHWWGATLIDNPNKIICCPLKWFFDDAPIDIIPDNWVKIKG